VAVERIHDYTATVTWIGSDAGATKTYAGYSREHSIAFEGKEGIVRGSADRAFRGDVSLVNPEELLLASLSACHMLSYLAFCSLEGIEIVSYADRARGMMSETGGAGRFVSVVLEPKVVVAKREFVDRARALHGAAHEACFIANSMNFPVLHKPSVIVAIEETA
jgi:organic hydroperoxide reductase OsmC/OhrA